MAKFDRHKANFDRSKAALEQAIDFRRHAKPDGVWPTPRQPGHRPTHIAQGISELTLKWMLPRRLCMS